jgi:hypothetical protein
MSSKNVILPDINAKKDEYGYGLAFKLAREQLASINDIEERCRKSGSSYRTAASGGTITLKYLNRTYCILFPEIEVCFQDNQEEIPIRDKILILHYIIQAKGTALSNEAITYKEFPGGAVYFRTFYKRAIQPIVANFTRQPSLLVEMAKKLNGQETDCGDIAVTISPFSRVPLTLALWEGDEELPATGNILFDKNITDYLSIEDINVLCETVAWRLVKLHRQQQ